MGTDTKQDQMLVNLQDRMYHQTHQQKMISSIQTFHISIKNSLHDCKEDSAHARCPQVNATLVLVVVQKV